MHNVVFDFGNVLGKFDKLAACEKLAAYSKSKAASEIYNLIVGSELEKLLESGTIDEQTFAMQLIKTIDAARLSVKKCLQTWGDIFETKHGMTELLSDLKERGIRMAVLSTTSAVHWPYIRSVDTIKLLESWNVPVILSFREKALKPAARLFTATLSALGCTARDAVFVDDLAENIEAAKKLGIAGIHYDCTKQSLDYLRDSLDRIVA